MSNPIESDQLDPESSDEAFPVPDPPRRPPTHSVGPIDSLEAGAFPVVDPRKVPGT